MKSERCNSGTLRNHHPVDDFTGLIEEIFLVHSVSGKDSKETVREFFRNLFSGFPERIRFTIVFHFFDSRSQEERELLFQYVKKHEGNQHEISWLKFSDFFELSTLRLPQNNTDIFFAPLRIFYWAQDTCIALKKSSDDQTILCYPVLPAPRSYQYASFSPILTGIKRNILLRPSNLKFEGGNVLVVGKSLLVGMDTIMQNIPKNYRLKKICGLKRQIEKIKDEMCFSFGVDQVEILHKNEGKFSGSSNLFQGDYQPIYHLDLYISPVKMDQQDNWILFIGDIIVLDKTGQPIAADHLISKPVKKIIRSLNNLANTLSQQFTVRRLPLILIWDEMLKKGYYYSYNNCLFESDASGRTAYLNDFHGSQKSPLSDLIKVIQLTVRLIFENAGINAVFIKGDWDSIAQLGGGLHCLAKVIRRENIPRK